MGGALRTHVTEHVAELLQLGVVGLALLQLGDPALQSILPRSQPAQTPQSLHRLGVLLGPAPNARQPRPARLGCLSGGRTSGRGDGGRGVKVLGGVVKKKMHPGKKFKC